MTDLLSSAEVAQLLGVSPASVKRWADAGQLPCVKTAGQHRRFRREAIERFRRSHQGAEADEEVAAAAQRDTDGWIDHLLRPQPPGALDAALVGARADLGSWWRVCTQLGPVLTGLGDRWARGEISAADEHRASERLGRALARMSDWMPLHPTAPNCLLATATGDEHTLGLSLVELCLRERGWATTWIGRSAPADAIAQTIGQMELQLVALSASAYSSDARTLSAFAEQIGSACAAVAVPLLLGGSGRWPERPRHGRIIRDFGSLTELLALLGGV